MLKMLNPKSLIENVLPIAALYECVWEWVDGNNDPVKSGHQSQEKLCGNTEHLPEVIVKYKL